MSVSLLQQVEIVKVLFKGADIIIMDEPTSVLTPQGIEGLFRAIRFLTSMGKTIIFITHKLKEVFAISDRITVLKDGKVSGDLLPSEATEEQICELMVGRSVALTAEKLLCQPGDQLLCVRDLHVKNDDGVECVKGLDLDIYAGEIVGIAGVAGSGQREMVRAIYGMLTAEKGSRIEFNGKSILNMPPRAHMLMGIGYIPQDRLVAGSAKNMAIWENCIMGRHISHKFHPKWLMDYNEAQNFTNRVLSDYKVKSKSIFDKVCTLSGGNIQKMIVGREFSQDKRLYIIEDPTRGIDVGAIEFIWKKIIEIAHSGSAVLLVSHELNEVMQLSDRIKVMFDGKLYDGGKYGELSDKEIGALMTGGVQNYEVFEH